MTPCTKYFWMKGYTQMMGTVDTTMVEYFMTLAMVLQLCGSRGVGAGISSVHVGDQEQFAQPQLQGELIPVAEENHGVEVGVPVANRHVQGNNRNDGLGQGDGNLENKPGVEQPSMEAAFKQVVGQRGSRSRNGPR